MELVPVSRGGGAGRVGGRGGGRRSPGRERFDGPFLAFDLSEDVWQRLNSEDVFGQLS